MPDKINVVFCIDTSYVQQLGATLASLFMHNEAKKLKVFIVSPPLDPCDLMKLESIGQTFGGDMVFSQAEDERISGFREHLHISRATYYRLLLPEIFSDVDKFIYLDCDLVVEADLRELWDTDIATCGCAGVDQENSPDANRLGLHPDFYINAGILLLNLSYWRANNIMEKCLDWLVENPQKAVMLEQDAINVILRERKAKIDLKWNLNPAPYPDLGILKQYPSRILHFAGSLKPWHKYYDFDLQAIYRKYVDLTPWSGEFLPQEPRNAGQACLVANQLYKRNDFLAACTYYQQTINFKLKTDNLDSKLLLDCINGGHRHFNSQDYVSACEHYRSCIEHWGYPVYYDSVYRMPGTLDGMY